MSTFVDGAPPSMAPEPADEPDHCDKKTDSGSLWLQDEIARRIAAKSSGTGGRHARRDNPDPSTAEGYVPRHSTVLPGPAAAAPASVAPPPPSPRKLPRRGPAGT